VLGRFGNLCDHHESVPKSGDCWDTPWKAEKNEKMYMNLVKSFDNATPMVVNAGSPWGSSGEKGGTCGHPEGG
jgi:hypothetical protein